MRRLAVVATVALLVLAACGDDSTSRATTATSDAGSAATEPAKNTVVDETVVDDSATDETVDESVVDETVVDATFPDDTADPNAPGIGSEFCDISDELNESDFDPFAATPDENEEFFTVSFPDMFGRLVVAAPAELDDDVAALAAAYGVLTTELENNGWDMTAAYANPAVQEAMTGDELAAAGGNLDAYCGL